MNKHWRVSIGIILVALLLGGAWWFTATPRYALYQVSRSIKHQDWQQFSTVVDVPSLSRSLALDLGGIATAALSGSEDANPILSRGFGALVALRLQSQLEDDFQGWVGGGTPGMLGTLLPPSGDGAGRISVKEISGTGNSRQATVQLKGGTRLVVELERAERGWRVTRILNVRELVLARSGKKS